MRSLPRSGNEETPLGKLRGFGGRIILTVLILTVSILTLAGGIDSVGGGRGMDFNVSLRSRPRRLARPRTPPSPGENTRSNRVGDAKRPKRERVWLCGRRTSTMLAPLLRANPARLSNDPLFAWSALIGHPPQNSALSSAAKALGSRDPFRWVRDSFPRAP